MIRRIRNRHFEARNRRFNERVDDGYTQLHDAALDAKDALNRMNAIIQENLEHGDLGFGDFAVIVHRMARDISEILKNT